MGLVADPWRQDVFRSDHTRVLLNCCRRSVESSTRAARTHMSAGQRRNLRIAYRTNSGNRAMTAQVITRRFMLTPRVSWVI